MQAVDSFDLVVQDNVDSYKLLPALWQAMEEEEKRTAVEIVNKDNGTWSVDCMKELVNKLTVAPSDLHSIQVAIWHSIENPVDLNCGMEDEDDSDSIMPTAKEPEVIALEKERQKTTDNLSMYEPHPKGLQYLPKFDHMMAVRQHEYADKQKDHKISDYLHIHLPKKWWTDSAQDLFRINYHNVLESNVLKMLAMVATICMRPKQDWINWVASKVTVVLLAIQKYWTG